MDRPPPETSIPGEQAKTPLPLPKQLSTPTKKARIKVRVVYAITISLHVNDKDILNGQWDFCKFFIAQKHGSQKGPVKALSGLVKSALLAVNQGKE